MVQRACPPSAHPRLRRLDAAFPHLRIALVIRLSEPGNLSTQYRASRAPQILGGLPGSGGSSSSLSLGLRGGNNTVSRTLRPFPLSFCARAFQHSLQMSYSLPSISFARQSLASPQRSQVIMGSSRHGCPAALVGFIVRLACESRNVEASTTELKQLGSREEVVVAGLKTVEVLTNDPQGGARALRAGRQTAAHAGCW